MIPTKEEKEKHVLALYSQGKTYCQIATEARISPNEIRTILKKDEEKNNVVSNDSQQLSLSTKADSSSKYCIIIISVKIWAYYITKIQVEHAIKC